MSNYYEKLGAPDLKLAGLAIWVHESELYSNDCVDEGWRNVTIHCGAKGASVMVNGSILNLSQMSHLLSGVEKLNKRLKGKAEMYRIEPEFALELKAEKHGRVKMIVNITPDFLHQKHTFEFEIDQSYLPKLITECKNILKKY